MSRSACSRPGHFRLLKALLWTPRRLAVLSPRRSRPKAETSCERSWGLLVKVAFKDGQPNGRRGGFCAQGHVDVGSHSRKNDSRRESISARTYSKKGRTEPTFSPNRSPKEDRRNLLGEERCTGAASRRNVCASSALAGHSARRRSGAAGVCRHSRRQRQPRPSHPVVGSARLSSARPITRPRWPADRSSLPRRSARQRIRKALDAATRTIPGARWREDKSLLDTVVNLTEFPSVVLGSFDPEFLALADEVLVTVMRDHQKYFALEDANGKLLAALPRCA